MHDFPPFINVDPTQCVDQVCQMEAFGCTEDGCDKGGITYRFVEKELKAELVKQCAALKLDTNIKFVWYLPPDQKTSATSAVAMVCNGAFNSSKAELEGSEGTMCPSAGAGPAGYKGPTPFDTACVGPTDTSCTSTGPDIAAGSVQIRIDRAALVQFSSQYLTVTQQVAIRQEPPTSFIADLPSNLGLIFGPFDQGLWIAILVEVVIITFVFLFVEGAVNDDIAEGWTSISDTFYWSFTTVLGGADKAPVSIGGKVVFVGHAIFALIIAATYTGSLAAFLISSSGLAVVDGFDALATGKFGVALRGPEFDSSAPEPLFKGSHSGGNAANQTTESTQFMVMQSLMTSSSTTSFTMFTYNRMMTRTAEGEDFVYAKGSSPCKDKANELGVYDAVLCGKDGDTQTPEALVHDSYSLIYELNRRKEIDGHCKLVTRGISVNPSGMALAFPLSSELHIPFSKAILNLNSQGVVQDILRSESFQLHKNKCPWTSTSGGSSINLSEMTGLFMLTFGGIFIAMLIGAVERFFYFKGLAVEDEEGGEENGEAPDDEEAIAEPGAADEENVNDEYECITGLLDELGDQMGRIEGLSSSLADLRDKAEKMGAVKSKNDGTGPAANGDTDTDARAAQADAPVAGDVWNPMSLLPK